MLTQSRTRVFLLLFSVQTGATVLSGESLPFQNSSGAFTLSSVTSPSNMLVTNAPANASFAVATPGYFLFSGTGAGAGTAVMGPTSAGSASSSSPAAVLPNLGGAELAHIYSAGESDSNPLSRLSSVGSPTAPGDPDIADVPEPGTVVLVGIGLVLIGIWKNASRVRV
jgi:hypothetical protein